MGSSGSLFFVVEVIGEEEEIVGDRILLLLRGTTYPILLLNLPFTR